MSSFNEIFGFDDNNELRGAAAIQKRVIPDLALDSLEFMIRKVTPDNRIERAALAQEFLNDNSISFDAGRRGQHLSTGAADDLAKRAKGIPHYVFKSVTVDEWLTYDVSTDKYKSRLTGRIYDGRELISLGFGDGD
jgi:hypothetical protein